ncbi:MAG: iron-sulfur cluster repair di-iron protein [Deltaproteobacteria bacterium]|nr:iron-sulfur cluster repair di-iron protein [Deltaproteobacteria bacterium]
MLNPNQSVASIVLEHSQTAPILQRLRIDFCCRGSMSLAAACEAAGISTEVVVSELTRAIETVPGVDGVDPRTESTPALIARIIATHHAYLRGALPFLRPLAAKVARTHGEHNPRLEEVSALVAQLTQELVPHLDFEEESLFPLLMARSADAPRVARELASMTQEHHAVGDLLQRMRAATEDFRVPEWACTSYRTLFTELERLEGDILRHVHLENHVLAPRFALAN